LRLLLLDPFPATTNPNPHLLSYVGTAAYRILGSENVNIARVSDWGSLPPNFDAGLVFGSLAFVRREIRLLGEKCRGAHVPLFCWSTDDPYEIDTNLESRDCFDWIWTNDKASLPFYDSEKATHLPLAADPATHLIPFPDESASLYDVSFVGVEFLNRRELIEELKRFLSGLRTAIVGPNWSVTAKFIRRAKISNQEAAQISNRSKIVLNLGRSYDLANTRGITPSTPGPRTFEVGGCSTVQLVTWEQPEIEEYYTLGKEVIFCDGVEELKEQIMRLLNDRSSRKQIADASFNKTNSTHLYDHRLRKIIGTIQNLTS
jgi:spore maturation protein CgeB